MFIELIILLLSKKSFWKDSTAPKFPLKTHRSFNFIIFANVQTKKIKIVGGHPQFFFFFFVKKIKVTTPKNQNKKTARDQWSPGVF